MDTVSLSHRISPFVAAWGLRPIVKRNGADADANAVAYADIPIHGNVGSMNSQFAAFGAPGFVSVVFSRNFQFGLKIRVNRQKIHQL